MTPGSDLDRMLSRLVTPALGDLAAQLRTRSGLAAAERAAVVQATAAVLREVLWQQVSRVVVLELHVARLGGQLTAADASTRWQEWVDRLAQPGAWEALAEPYPVLLPRLRTIIENRCAAASILARRFARDRPDLPGTRRGSGELRAVTFGAGDSHQGGQTVTMLDCDSGRLVYKPRSVTVDAALDRLLSALHTHVPEELRIRVPLVDHRTDQAGAYGWVEYVPHRYCEGDAELRAFYRGLGHWLAVMRLLRGSDLHSGNVVAAGPVPVVVDCETLFTPHRAADASGYGAAVDRASELLSQSVLRTGLLPGRGAVLGWRGGDPSAAGYLPGQQPALRVPTILDHGTDRARFGVAAVPPAPAANLPSPEPDLGRYWQDVVDGFTDLTQRFRELDRAATLAPLLTEFADTPIRVVLRDTASYTALIRMLWHPSSLHEPEPAIRQVVDLLTRQAANRPTAPGDPTVINAELADLLEGDVPVFTTTPSSGELVGPRGTRWGVAEDLVATALDSWRSAPVDTDRRVVKTTLIAAYLNDGAPAGPAPPTLTPLPVSDLERTRRQQAAGIMQRTVDTAIVGDDGTATWIAQALERTGYAVRPMSLDVYSGLYGVAVVLAAYQREVVAGRADQVAGLESLLAAVLRTLRFAQEQQAKDRAELAEAGIRARPEAPGAYLGLGSRIWSWLLLHRLGAVEFTDAITRAEELAELVPEAIRTDDYYDLLGGMAGAVVPLLRLSEQAGTGRWRQLAAEIGDRLGTLARRAEAGAYWPGEAAGPDGLGGTAHGVTGIGWALARLAAGDPDQPWAELAEAGFAWEESLFDPQQGTWWDARAVNWGEPPRSWCNGSVGIGICAADLLDHGGGARWREVLARAARASWPAGFGDNSTVCHGDFGAWELLERAITAGVGPPGLTRDQVVGQALSGLSEYGPLTDGRRDVFQPGLFIGGGGVAYQLLRMHPECDLPSILLPDPVPPGHAVRRPRC